MKKTIKKSMPIRVLTVFLALLMMCATLILSAGAESLSGRATKPADGIPNAYSETKFSCTTNKSGGNINAVLEWHGTSFTAWYGVTPRDAQYIRHENWLNFNGSDDPVSGGSWTAYALAGTSSVHLATIESERVENNKDRLVHCFEQHQCWQINVSFDYTVNNKDFVTQQGMQTKGCVRVNGTDYLMDA